MRIRLTVTPVHAAMDKIARIKVIRALSTLGLKEAKDLVEDKLMNTGDSIIVNVDAAALARFFVNDRESPYTPAAYSLIFTILADESGEYFWS